MQKTDIIRDVTEILKNKFNVQVEEIEHISCLLYTSPSPRDCS